MGMLREEDRPLMEALLNHKDELTKERDRARTEIDRLRGMREQAPDEKALRRLELEICRVNKIQKDYTKQIMELTVQKIAQKFDEDDETGIGISQVRYQKKRESHYKMREAGIDMNIIKRGIIPSLSDRRKPKKHSNSRMNRMNK